MKKSKVSIASFLTILVLLSAFFAATTAAAQEADPEPESTATVTVGTNGVTWQPVTDSAGYVLTIAGPGDFYLRREFQRGASINFDTNDAGGASAANGVYKYELLALSRGTSTNQDAELRGLVPYAAPPIQSGSFSILDGSFVRQDITEGATIKIGPEANAPNDQVILDDLIVDGSACIGFDCVNGESFGFDTLRLKENNLRIHFQDTSNTSSFPTNDWRIIANDSANGGASYLAIEDASAGSKVFVVEAGAGSNALYVDDYGRVGLGTSTPVVEMHVKDSDTPTVRLDQDGSGGWTPQVWDVAGNESNFFVRDATNGSKLPFRIQPGAPSSSLSIKGDGNVGIGTWSPAYALEVEATGSNPVIVSDRTDGAMAKMSAAPDRAFFGSASNHVVDIIVNGSRTARFELNGDLTINGALHDSSDVNLKENFSIVNSRAVLETLAGLPITSWNYRADSPELRHMGPVSQDFYQAFGLGMDDKHIAPLDTSGVALASIQGLYEMASEKDAQIQALQVQNAQLESRLAALEQAATFPPAPETSSLAALPWVLCGLLLLAGVAMGGKRFLSARA